MGLKDLIYASTAALLFYSGSAVADESKKPELSYLGMGVSVGRIAQGVDETTTFAGRFMVRVPFTDKTGFRISVDGGVEQNQPFVAYSFDASINNDKGIEAYLGIGAGVTTGNDAAFFRPKLGIQINLTEYNLGLFMEAGPLFDEDGFGGTQGLAGIVWNTEFNYF